MNDKFLKPYNSAEAEERVAKLWNESGFFNPDNLPTGLTSADGKPRFVEPFSIVLPPPNVTGVLHMGSALMLAVEDIMVRYARMTGKKTLWIPGTDHAGIATQAKVETEIKKKEGKSRHDLGREELLKRVEAFAKESHDTIITQAKKMGSSLDWSREAFTLDEKRSLAVRTAFKKMYDDGLIYRGHRVVNWDPKGQTTISDDEIVYEPRKAKMYTFRYSKDIPISISTTRPETKLGDTAIAVHPDDPRYKEFVGKEFDAVFAGEPIHIKVVADMAVEKDFGTGALGVTPAHSTIDWEMAQRHNLPLKQVINEYAKMTVGNEAVLGKKTTDAREAVVEWLREQGLLEKEEEIDQNVATAERTGGIVEPLPKLQWFIAVNKEFKQKGETSDGRMVTLKTLMKDAVAEKGPDGKSGITILPDRYERVYYNWIENLRDWCISRQIWYGHRVPVWYKKAGDGAGGETEEIYCGIDAPKGDEWTQDEDTLDTWFSSGLWTFSTLGWPLEKEFAKHRMYHPTTVLETAYDILFFWVARMILMSTYLLGEVPFKTVYLHGLVRDGQGRKISKSLGNNIDPLDMIAKYGADAVRMSLIIGTGPGNDSRISEDKIKGYRNFSNKLWNITRFVLSQPEMDSVDVINAVYTPADQKLADELSALIKEVTTEMNEYKFYLVAEKLYHYAWHTYADVILEESKAIILGTAAETDPGAANSRKRLLMEILEKILILLHPFIPFVTEEIWSYLPKSKNGTTGDTIGSGLLIVSEWPTK